MRDILGVILLSCWASSVPVTDPSCTYKAVGDSISIAHEYKKAGAYNIMWYMGKQVIAQRKKDHVLFGTEEDIDKNGYLHLRNLRVSQSGDYQADVYDNGGKHLHRTPYKLCVLEKVSKPKVTFKCDNEHATLTCEVGDTKDVEITWMCDKKSLENQKDLTLTWMSVTSEHRFACEVSNKVSRESSLEVAVLCPGRPNLLFGLDWHMMMAILAGGGSLLLILSIVLLICCCCKCRRQHQQDEEQERLAHRLQHPHPSERSGVLGPPKGHLGPSFQHRGDQTPQLPKPRSKSRPRPPPVPMEMIEQPPPRPRPRQHGPRKNHS